MHKQIIRQQHIRHYESTRKRTVKTYQLQIIKSKKNFKGRAQIQPGREFQISIVCGKILFEQFIQAVKRSV